MTLNPEIFVEEQRFGPRQKGSIETMIYAFRSAAFKAEGPAEMLYFAMPAHVALMIATKLEIETDRMIAKGRFMLELDAIREAAESTIKDEAMRFVQATCDLELLLMEFIGRPPMTMEEVRQQQAQMALGGPGPQPFIRSKRVPISQELVRSLRQNKIGNPREPGEEG